MLLALAADSRVLLAMVAGSKLHVMVMAHQEPFQVAADRALHPVAHLAASPTAAASSLSAMVVAAVESELPAVAAYFSELSPLMTSDTRLSGLAASSGVKPAVVFAAVKPIHVLGLFKLVLCIR